MLAIFNARIQYKWISSLFTLELNIRHGHPLRQSGLIRLLSAKQYFVTWFKSLTRCHWALSVWPINRKCIRLMLWVPIEVCHFVLTMEFPGIWGALKPPTSFGIYLTEYRLLGLILELFSLHLILNIKACINVNYKTINILFRWVSILNEWYLSFLFKLLGLN